MSELYVSMVPTFDKRDPGQTTYIVMEVCNHKMTTYTNASFRKKFVRSYEQIFLSRIEGKLC